MYQPTDFMPIIAHEARWNSMVLSFDFTGHQFGKEYAMGEVVDGLLRTYSADFGTGIFCIDVLVDGYAPVKNLSHVTASVRYKKPDGYDVKYPVPPIGADSVIQYQRNA